MTAAVGPGSLSPTVAATDGAPPSTRPRGRRLRRVGTALLVVGLAGLGGLAGWWVRGQLADPPPPAVEVNVERPIVEEAGEASDSAMPSLAGLSEDDAREALFQLGLTAEVVEVELVPAAGQSGLVVRQDPAPGTVSPERATIGISAPATVPELVGASEEDARAQLVELGAQVSVEVRYDPASPAEGTVLEVQPAEGEPLVDAATLIVAGPASSVYASQIDAIEGSCGSDTEARSNGQTFTDSVVCSVSAGADEPTTEEWLLNRQVGQLVFDLGQDDESTTGFRVGIRVFADDRLVAEQSIGYGEGPVRVTAPVAGALRVRVELAAPADDCCEYVDVVLGDARFLGSPDAIDALVEANG